jgi:hypothetical protein
MSSGRPSPSILADKQTNSMVFTVTAVAVPVLGTVQLHISALSSTGRILKLCSILN